MKKIFHNSTALALATTLLISACASSVNVAVDPTSISNKAKFDQDYKLCQDIAKTYDLSKDTNTNAALGAAAGAVGVAGVAVALAGAVFAPAIPFIVAGGAIGGGLAGGSTKSKESEARESILSECLNSKGYKAFGVARVR